jgi:hypothetical protein
MKMAAAKRVEGEQLRAGGWDQGAIIQRWRP